MKNYVILGASIIIGLALHGYITRANYQISSFGSGVHSGAYRTNLQTGEMDMYEYDDRISRYYFRRVTYLPPEMRPSEPPEVFIDEDELEN